MQPLQSQNNDADQVNFYTVSNDDETNDSNDILSEQSAVLGDSHHLRQVETTQEGWKERESRNALRHVSGLSTELEDVHEVEYRKVRLERVVLISVWSSAKTTAAQAEESLRELAALADTAGAQVVDGLLQHRLRPDPATYLGSGKAKEVARIVDVEEADTIIVNTDLPPSQRRALEDITRVKVVDRTALILDIFAQHATSREGKAQVELAQLQYMLPRLRGWGATLSRQAGGQSAGANGGIGSRGPGETKIEMDRRRIRRRISKLKNDIAHMAPSRSIKRGSRHRINMPIVAVVGYTNAGKSSLINALTHAHELVGNALFATLDTAVRSTQTQTGRLYGYADTVGFVRNLPTQLVDAFTSSLEEIADSDLIVHVVDASYIDPQEQIDAVNMTIEHVNGIENIQRVMVFNKVDILTSHQREHLKKLYPQAVFVSAQTGEGINILRHKIEEALPVPPVQISAQLDFNDGGLIEKVRSQGIIDTLNYTDQGIEIDARVDDALAAHIMQAEHK